MAMLFDAHGTWVVTFRYGVRGVNRAGQQSWALCARVSELTWENGWASMDVTEFMFGNTWHRVRIVEDDPHRILRVPESNIASVEFEDEKHTEES
jgi:hypothetical protein